MRSLYIVSGLLVIFSFSIFGEEDNRLKNRLLSAEEALKTGDFELSLEVVDQELKQLIAEGNDSIEVDFLYVKSSALQGMGQYRRSMLVAEIGLEKSIKWRDSLMMARFYNELGICHDYLGSWSVAIENYLAALDLYDQLALSEGRAHALNNIGITYSNLKDFELAERYLMRALRLSEEQKLDGARLNAMSNLGMIYNQTGRYAEAFEYYLKVLEEDKKDAVSGKLWLGSDYSNLSTTLLKMNQASLALRYADSALGFKKLGQNPRFLASGYQGKADALIDLNRFLEARYYLDSAEQQAAMAEDPALILEIKQSRLSWLEGQRMLDEAIILAKDILKLKNELYDKEVLKVSKSLLTQFELDKKEERASVLEQQLKQKGQLQNLYNVLLLMISFGAILFLLLWWRLRQKNRLLAGQSVELNRLVVELRLNQHKLQESVEQANNALAIRNRFISIVSHEIRTPLNVIVNAMRFIFDDPKYQIEPEKKEMLETSSIQLLELVNNILDQSKLQAGKMRINEGVFSIEALMKQVSNVFVMMAQRKGIEFRVNKLAKEYISTDELKLQRILTNLMSNAVKFTEKGWVEVSAYLEGEGHQKRLVLEVKDTGVGIKASDIESIFKPFEQLDQVFSSGTGLGLTITKDLVDLLGGAITVSSDLNSGSSFMVRIPVTVVQKPEKSSINAYQVAEAKDLKVLVAEDNMANVRILSYMFKKIGCKFISAINGKIAVEMATKDQYDLILMDLNMPEMSGLEAAKLIRAQETIRGTKSYMVLLSAADKEEINSMPDGLFDALFQKPFHLDNLQALVSDITKRK